MLEPGQNLGFAAANNFAAKHATGEWLAFLNPDAYPVPIWLAAVVAAIEKYPWADAFGSLQINAQDHSKYDGIGDAYFFAGIPYRGEFGRKLKKNVKDGECIAPCAAASFTGATFSNNFAASKRSFFVTVKMSISVFGYGCLDIMPYSLARRKCFTKAPP